MKKYIGIAVIAAIFIPGCSSGGSTTVVTQADPEPTTSSSTTSTTTTEPTEVSIGVVEDAFRVNQQKKADDIADTEKGAAIYVKDVDCSRVSEGRATCYVTSRIEVGSYSRASHGAWNVTYDLEDGHPRSYHPR